MKTILIIFLCCIIFCSNVFSQQYSCTELSPIKPLQVIIENYTCINLSTEIMDDAMANRFDVNNPYTYLQMLHDESGNGYHILLQTNFSGKILFLAYSNNLSAVFNKADRPKFIFQHCLKEINRHISSIQVKDAVIKCMIDRLNYCSEDQPR